MIIVSCDRTDCEETFEVGAEEGDWSPAPQMARDLIIRDLEFGDLLYVYLPEGWSIDVNHLDRVIHCPDHAIPMKT